MKWENVNQLCDIVRETGFAVHCYLRNGHLEEVYENALAHRLQKLGLQVLQQHPLTVYDEDGFVLGSYFADLFIEGCLTSSRIETGLLINFGASKFYIKKYLKTPHPDFHPFDPNRSTSRE